MIWTGKAPPKLSKGKRVIRNIFMISGLSDVVMVIALAWSVWAGDSAVVGHFVDFVGAPNEYVKALAVIYFMVGMGNLVNLIMDQERNALKSLLFAMPLPVHILMTALFNTSNGSWVALVIYMWGALKLHLITELREPYDRVIR